MSEVQCSGSFRTGTVRLYAKDYVGPKETLEDICARDWKSYYGPALVADRADAKLLQHGADHVCVVEAEGRASDGQLLSLREWYQVAPGHVRIVGAAMPMPMASKGGEVVADWRAGVQFGDGVAPP